MVYSFHLENIYTINMQSVDESIRTPPGLGPNTYLYLYLYLYLIL